MPRCHRFLWTICLLCTGIIAIFAPSRLAAKDPAQICDAATVRAANDTGVPLEVLRSLLNTNSENEKEVRLRPWPWTVNLEGHGIWFETTSQAQAYVFRHFRKGARRFEVGCFGISYERHGAAFSSVEDMFNPNKNADYAAGILKQLHAELGSWDRAVSAYQTQRRRHAPQNLLHLQADASSLSPERRHNPERRPGTATLRLQDAGQHHTRYGSLVPLEDQRLRGALISPGGS